MATQPEPIEPMLPIDDPVPEPADPSIPTPTDPGVDPTEPPPAGTDPWHEGP